MLKDVRDMHYDYKQKLNKIDSEKYRNLRVPEIDWKLNDAQAVYIKMIAEPRYRQNLGFETSQRTTDDISSIVVNPTDLQGIIPTIINPDSYYAALPADYMFHISSYVFAKKGSCIRKIRTTVRQHDDLFQESPFDNSSFEWETVNILFYDKGIKIFTDKTFEIQSLIPNYIRIPKQIHNAQDYINGTYTMPNGTVLTGFQNCELPQQTWSEIVDLAVLITTGDLIPDYNVKQAKVEMTN